MTVYYETEIKYWLKWLLSSIWCNFYFKGEANKKKLFIIKVKYFVLSNETLLNYAYYVFDKIKKS